MWFHGTNVVLKPGDVLRPGDTISARNYPGGNSSVVWVCDDPYWAALWAGAAHEMNDETAPGWVYEVEPVGAPIEVPGDPGDGPQFCTPQAVVVRQVSLGEAGTPHVDELDAWCTVRTETGIVIRTNSAGDHPAGAAFIAALDDAGTQLGWWPVDSWSDPNRARSTMASIWATISGGDTVWDDDYDVEYHAPLERGAVRCCPSGTYVRLIDENGDELDGGSAYWCDNEWVEDPELVMGAILGAAASLS